MELGWYETKSGNHAYISENMLDTYSHGVAFPLVGSVDKETMLWDLNGKHFNNNEHDLVRKLEKVS